MNHHRPILPPPSNTMTYYHEGDHHHDDDEEGGSNAHHHDHDHDRDHDDDIHTHTHTHHRDNDNGGYVKLRWDPHPEEAPVAEFSPATRGLALWWWVKLVASLICLAFLAFIGFKWVGPFFIQKVIIPIMNWVRNTFSIPELAIMVLVSVALFPTLLLPSSPSMWIAGMTFGYGFGFLLLTSAVAVGVSLPFFIGSILLQRKIEGWLEKYPKRASILRAAGGGNWFHQFKAVVLIRVSPFPYILFNYCSVATNVKYGPYLLGSLVGMVPDIVLSIYTGMLIRTLADASHKEHRLSALEIIVNVVCFVITVATIIFITVFAKRRLKELEQEDELLLQ